MNIDWKHLATTTGYKSLKAAYCSDLKEKYRTKYQSAYGLRSYQTVTIEIT